MEKDNLTWSNFLSDEKHQSYFTNILQTIVRERSSGITVYPAQKDIFNAFKFTEFRNIKVVIIGQDPYHGPKQANGLAFSVYPGVNIPPSLLEIYREIKRSIPRFIKPNHGYLESWAKQGVLLLNTILTVRSGQANSHAGLGWEIFTDKVIRVISEHLESVVFLLWGSRAQKKELLIDEQRHYILKSYHPSPLSAYRGFLGCNHFILVNLLLKRLGKEPINWTPILPT